MELASTIAAGNQTVGDSLGDAAAPSASGGAAKHFVRGRELARGGMGKIVIAEDSRLERTVALKLLQRVSPALRARFEREATITARLAHPAIVPVYERGELDNGEPFYVMKLVDGTPLDATIAKAADLPARLALLSSAMAVCEALAYAHSRRIIHRDLKPANVLVGKFGETVVIDWGIAKDLRTADLPAEASDNSGDGSVTLDGEIVGTPSYMPPEQANGSAVDERADVYALGALLYHVIAGRPPYLGRSAGEVLAAVEAGPPPAIGTLEPDVPDDLASIIGKAMARAPADRYPSAGELADELRRFIDGRLVSSHRYSGAELLRRWARKHRAPIAVAAVALCVLVAGGIWSVRKILARERETEAALAASQLEQGRQLLVAGDPGQATPYLAAALAVLPDDPIAQRLGAISQRDAHRHIATLTGTAMAFGADELFVGRDDGTVVVYDAATGAQRRTFTAAVGAIRALDVAPDGALIAVAGARGLELHASNTGRVSTTVSADPVTSVHWLPHGDRLAYATVDRIAIAGLDGKEIARVAAAEGGSLVVDDAAVVATTPTGAFAWSTTDLHPIATAPAVQQIIFAARLDRGTLLTAGSSGLMRWRTDTEEHIAEPILTEQVVTLVELPDHAFVAGGTLIGKDPPHAFSHDTIEASAALDATHVITGGYDRVLRVWDLERGARPSIVVDAAAATESIIARGTHAASRGRAPTDAIELWDFASTRAPDRSMPMTMEIQWILADHRDRLAVRLVDNTTRLMTMALAPIATIPGWPVAFRPHGDELITDVDGRLTVSSASTGAKLREVTEAEPIYHAAYSESGDVIATCAQHRAWIRDAHWTTIATFESTDEINAIAVDDAGHVATGHDSGAVRIWDARTGARLVETTGHDAHVSTLELRGSVLTSTSWDSTIRRWSVPSGTSLGSQRFDRPMSSIDVSPDGRLMAATDGTAAVSLFDSELGHLLEIVPTGDRLERATFVDDDHLAVGGDGGHLEILDLTERPPGELVSPRWKLENGRAVERH